jgi:hypothetical protein
VDSVARQYQTGERHHLLDAHYIDAREYRGRSKMDLPEDIRRKIETSGDKEIFLEVVSRLQSEKVEITHDVLAAIRATIDLTKDVVE